MTDQPRRDPGVSEGRALSLHPLLQLTLSRVREFIREPEAVFWVFIFPVLLALALGIAFRNRPPEDLVVGVENSAPAASRYAQILEAAPGISSRLEPPPEAARQLRIGKVDVVVRPDDDGYTFVFDPTRPQSRLARLAADDALQRGLGRKDVAVIQEAVVNEPGSRYIDFLIPGLIGLNLMGSGMWGIGFNVVNARTRKLLKRMVATPMRRSHFLLSFMLSRIVFLFLEVIALVAFGAIVFNVRMEGSLISFLIVAFIGALTFSGLGLLVAARAQSIEAVSGWMNFVMLPMWLLSGSFFSYDRFPAVTLPFIRLLPLTASNDALRAIMNEGASLASTWPQLAVIIFWGILSFTVALKIFRWQ